MSDLQQILTRSQTDYDFYLALLTNPDETLASYSLSESERAALTGERMALWNLLGKALPVEGGVTPRPESAVPFEPVEPPGPPPPGPPPPGPPPPGPPPPGPPPPGPPPPGPPPPGPAPGVVTTIGPVPPGPPPPPPGIGVIISGHHNFFNVFQQEEDFLIDKIIADPAVIAAVQAIRTAENSDQRISAVSQLMERIG